MTSGPITSWQIDGETMETVTGSFLGLQNHCGWWGSHEIKRHLLLGRKAMTNLDSILKSRDITLLAKICLVKARVFPLVMYGCESWTIKQAECLTPDTFKLWCWRRLLRVPWMTRRSNQSPWIFIGRTDTEAGASILWPPDAGKDWRQEKGMTEDEMVGWHHQLNVHEFEQAPGDGERQGEAWRAAVHGVVKSQTQLSNWTTNLWDWDYIQNLFQRDIMSDRQNKIFYRKWIIPPKKNETAIT